MTWHKYLSQLEYIFIGLFLFFYLLYFIRMIIIARKTRKYPQRILVKFVIRSLYFALLIIALLGPSFGDSKKELKSVGKDIYVAMDLSPSMNAYDIAPSRLEKAKFELKHLLGSFHSDRIGIIIFSGEAFLHCPLTYDRNALDLFIDALNTALVPQNGTDYFEPLSLALEKHLSEENDSKDHSNKLVLMISDGEGFGNRNDQIAKKLQKKGIKVFTLGIGTEKGSKIPILNGFKKNENNQPVISKLQRSSLTNISEITGGEYYEINENSNETALMAIQIDKIKGKVMDEKKMDASANKYFYFLLIAIFLIMIDVLITTSTIIL